MALAAVGLSTHIYNNHVKSVLLLLGFPLLLLLMIGAFSAGMSLMPQEVRPGYYKNPYTTAAIQERAADTKKWERAGDAFLAGILRYGHWAFLGAFCWFGVAYFAHGALMRAATGAVPVTREQMPRIYNLLENLCISRGIPMPKFEVIDSPALNAYATGIGYDTYKIVLTRGLIDRLEDDELEGVIAHELTHIMNSDVRLLIIAVIFVGMISFFAEMAFRGLLHGMRPSYYTRRDNRGAGGLFLALLVGFAVLAIGYVFAIMIRFALSRRREYLADAGAVELTKNPDAMMRALLRISGNDRVRGMPDEVEQMCIENSRSFMGLFATHPPIADRVAALSAMTGAPVPTMRVSLRRGPRKPWDESFPA